MLDLHRHTETEILLDIHALDRADPIDADAAMQREKRLAQWYQNITSVETAADTKLVEIANGCMRDVGSLALMEGPENEWLTPAAGIPLYQSLWARDALTTTWQATMFDRGEMADSVLTTLARLQGVHHDTWRDE